MLEQSDIKKPEMASGTDKAKEAVYVEECKQYSKDIRNLEATLASLYNLVWGQCSNFMQNKLKATDIYDKFGMDSDVSKLLKQIKYINGRIDENMSI